MSHRNLKPFSVASPSVPHKGFSIAVGVVAAAAGATCVTFLSALVRPEETAPRGRGGVVALTASVVADLPVEQVERQLRNCGVYIDHAATA